MPTTSSARTGLRSALVLSGAACAFLTGLVALAGPTAAIEDPRRPTAQVTHGPSCGPSVVRVAVTNGSEPHALALVFDGAVEQDSAVLAAGEQAELGSGEIDWGRTVDVTVTVTDADGNVDDPIELGTYTRPSAEDCAAITPTTTPAQTQPSTSQPAPSTTQTAPTPAPVPPTTPTTSTPSTPRPSTPTTPRTPRPTGTAPATPSQTPESSTSDPAPSAEDRPSGQAGTASAASVSPGGVVTVRATGFAPGEPVTVSLVGVADPLATVVAAADGSVEAVVQIPRGAALGTATVQLVGEESASSAGLDLQVAARQQPLPGPPTPAPALAAGVTLIGTAGALGLLAARRSRGHHTSTPR